MELPNLLLWENVAMMISTRYNTDDVGNQAMDTLYRLINSTNNEILQKSCLLLRQIAEKMRVEMDKYMELFTKHAPEKASVRDKWVRNRVKPVLSGHLKRTQKIGFQHQLPLNAGQKYCRMIQGEHSAILSTFIEQSFSINTFVLSISKWPIKTGSTVVRI